MDLQKNIIIYISEYYGWLDTYSQIIAIEFDKFMELVVFKQTRLIGPEDIEKCWQALVLDTELYTKYCTTRFGKFIHYKILKLDQKLRSEQLKLTIKLYLEKYGYIANKMVWSQSQYSKIIKPTIEYQIKLNIQTKSGVNNLNLIYQFNSCDNFLNVKEIFGFKYQVPLRQIKIFINKTGLSDYKIKALQDFYLIGSNLEVPDKTNVSGLFNFDIKTFDLIY